MNGRYSLLRMAVMVVMLVFGQQAQAEVSRVTNLRSSVQEGVVTLRYDLESPSGNRAQVRFRLSVDGGQQWREVKGVSGDIGPGIEPGRDKRIVWSIGKEYPKGYTGPVIYEVQTRAEREQGAQLVVCQEFYDSNRLTTGIGGNAASCYTQLLQREPGNLAAVRGLLSIEKRYRSWAERAIAAGRLAKAKGYLGKLKQLNPEGEAVQQIQEAIGQARQRAQQTAAAQAAAAKAARAKRQRQQREAAQAKTRQNPKKGRLAKRRMVSENGSVVVFSDSFNGASVNAGSWESVSGAWVVANGLLRGRWSLSAAQTDQGNLLLAPSVLAKGSDFSAQIVFPVATSTYGWRLRLYNADGNLYDIVLYSVRFVVEKRQSSNTWSLLVPNTTYISQGVNVDCSIQVCTAQLDKTGNQYTIQINGSVIGSFTDTVWNGDTRLGLGVYGTADYDSFRLMRK